MRIFSVTFSNELPKAESLMIFRCCDFDELVLNKASTILGAERASVERDMLRGSSGSSQSQGGGSIGFTVSPSVSPSHGQVEHGCLLWLKL